MEQEAATTLDFLVRYMPEREGKENLGTTKSRNLSPQWNFQEYSSLRHVEIEISFPK